MIFFYFFALILIYLSYKSFRGGIKYLEFFKSELAETKPDFTPFATIFAPCRGIDAGLEENLSALFRQDFPVYEILFIADDKNDEAVSIIEKLITGNDKENVSAKLIFVEKASDSSQKVHNLREAVLYAGKKSEIFVFVDSDARPDENWLRNLVAPLQDEKIGCSTGYRWFISKRRNFASEMRSVWNASIASALGANLKSNFCWGGSMAVRREIFEKLDIREKWRGVLSDDFTVTRAMKNAGLPIFFVPQALTVSVEDCSVSELFEFTTRQMKITRVYAPNLWIASFIGSFLFNLVFIWGILIIIFSGKNSILFWFSICVLALVSAFSIGKSWLRLKAVRLILTDYETELRKQLLAQNTLWILTPALFFYNDLCALFSRKIVWRGTKYKLISPTRTSKLSEYN
jgi:ceramide glucosyltransferase